jgi:hypothetical protein
MQAIQIEVGLVVEAAVRDHTGDDLKAEAVIRRIEFQEPMDRENGNAGASAESMCARKPCKHWPAQAMYRRRP